MKKFISDNKWSLFGGIATMIFVWIGAKLLGNVSGYHAKELIATSLPGLNSLCNTIVLASATILALLLTLLGINSGTKTKIKNEYYQAVLNIAKFDTILFVSALVLFQLFNIPITESEEVPTSCFGIIYWVSLITSSILSGFMVTVILLLYSTVNNIITIVGMHNDDHTLLKTEDVDKKDIESKEE